MTQMPFVLSSRDEVVVLRDAYKTILRSTASLAILTAACFLGGAGSANATCTGLNTAVVNCTSPSVDAGAQISIFAGNTTTTATNWQLNNGRFFTETTAVGATARFNGDGVTITNGIGSGDGAIHVGATGAGGNAFMTISNSSVEETAPGSYGIAAHARNATGNASIEATNVSVIMAATATTGPGVLVITDGSGSSTLSFIGGSVVSSNGAPALAALAGTGNVSLTASGGTITTTGASSPGMIGMTTGAGTITINNSDTVNTAGSNGYGIRANGQSGAIGIANNGGITTSGNTSHGIYATATAGPVTIGNSGSVFTTGDTASGIKTGSSGGAVGITNTAAIQTSGQTSHGIDAFVTGGTVNVVSSGAIATTGTTFAGGILVNSVNAVATVDISNDITTAGSFSPAVEVISNTASGNLLYYHDGKATVHGFSNAISLWQGGNNATSATGTVHIGANTTVDASAALTGVQSLMLAGGTVQIDAGAEVIGGSGSGIDVAGQSSRLNNAGIVGALSDFAVSNHPFVMTNNSFDIVNAAGGEITGYMTLGTGVNTVNNAGLWNLRNFADSDGDLVRDKLAVALSDLGSSGSNTVNNSGTIALLGKGDATAVNLDTTGMYLPLGLTFNTMTLNSPIQGQIFGVQTFNNSGVIDLTANIEIGQPVVGDVLVISGGHTAGTDGGGVFVANGGTLRLNTVLNEGGANSQSDMLVVDSTRLGLAPTAIAITPAGTSSGALTVGNGIALVEVLNKSASADGVFVLGSRVAAGAFEYNLFHNGVGADIADGNWYLRNTMPINPLDPDSPVVPLVRPEVAVDMVIPPLAIEYGYAMLDTLHERVGETWLAPATPGYEERTVWCKNAAKNFRCVVRVPLASANGANQNKWASSGWARLIGERGMRDNNNFMQRGADYNYTFGGIQAGLDLYGREQADGTFDRAGIYVGYGQISSDVKGQFGTKAGSVDMNAYTVGGYWTHYAASGWYTDAVIQGTWYSADAKSNLGQRIKPDGFGLIGSLEGGYSFKLGNSWTLEPQAQLAYQHVNFDNTRDAFGFVSFADGESLRGRLGVRLTRTWDAGQDNKPRLITGWLRANVWHEFMGNTKTQFGTLDGRTMTPFHSDLGGTWGEIGAGVSGQISEKVSLFGTAAYNRSLDNRGRESWDGRLGMTVKW